MSKFALRDIGRSAGGVGIRARVMFTLALRTSVASAGQWVGGVATAVAAGLVAFGVVGMARQMALVRSHHSRHSARDISSPVGPLVELG